MNRTAYLRAIILMDALCSQMMQSNKYDRKLLHVLTQTSTTELLHFLFEKQAMQCCLRIEL